MIRAAHRDILAFRRTPLPWSTRGAEDAATSNLHLEPDMNTRLAARTTSFALALLLTLGTLGAIDHLAAREPMSAQWASAVAPVRG